MSQQDIRNTLAPDLQKALQTRPFPDLSEGQSPPDLLTVRKNRAAHLAKLRHLYPIPGPIPDQVKEIEHKIPVRDGTSIPIRTYIPVSASALPVAERPVVVLFHEGGWSMGDLSDEDQNCRLFARELSAVCVNVDYRLAPEHSFPQGVEDCWDVVRYVAKFAKPESEMLPADPRRNGFVVGGASAGGNLAAVVAQLSVDEKLNPPITGQYLCCAALLAAEAVPEKWKPSYLSRTHSVSDPVLKMDPKNNLREALKYDPHSTLFSPLLRPDLRGLPPAYFQIGGLDPLRDEGEIYERFLDEAGVPTSLDVYEGVGHMFWTNW